MTSTFDIRIHPAAESSFESAVEWRRLASITLPSSGQKWCRPIFAWRRSWKLSKVERQAANISDGKPTWRYWGINKHNVSDEQRPLPWDRYIISYLLALESRVAQRTVIWGWMLPESAMIRYQPNKQTNNPRPLWRIDYVGEIDINVEKKHSESVGYERAHKSFKWNKRRCQFTVNNIPNFTWQFLPVGHLKQNVWTSCTHDNSKILHLCFAILLSFVL